METPEGRNPALPQDGKILKRVQDDRGEMSVVERLKAPTPKFFKRLRTVGLILAAAGGALVTAPVMLPTLVVTVGGYLIVAGTVVSAVSQAAVEGEGGIKKKEGLR